MERNPSRRVRVPLAFSIAAMAWAPITLAQSGPPGQPEGLVEAQLASLQEQNRELRRQVEALQQELSDAYAKLAEAQRQIAALQAPTDDGSTPAAAAPHDPFASPAGLLAELRRRYAAEIAVLPEPEDDRGRQSRAREVDRWCREVSREVRARREWIVRFTEVGESRADGAPATAIVLDRATGAPIDGPVQSIVPRRFADRMRSGAPNSIWRAQVVFAAAPRVNAARKDSSVFEGVPLIGPGVEFAYDLEWEAFAPGPGGMSVPSPTVVPAPSAPKPGEPR
ncbi:MAG: hypothetical protein RBS39_08605 [Phycisphaerales bacterium]|jgi:hypothetical protein|nr:hypothetical protein [Phycisphaerales bacterium]